MSNAGDKTVLSAEQAVIGAALLEPAALDKLQLEPGDFGDRRHRELYRAMLELHREQRPVGDAQLVIQHINGTSAEWVGGLMSDCISAVPEPGNVAFYAEAVSQHSHERRLRSALADIAGDPRLTAEEILTRGADIIERMRPRTDLEKIGAIGRRWRALDPTYLTRVPEPRRWLLRHPTIDGKDCPAGTGDGLLPLGKVGILASEGGAGKTNISIALAVSVAIGRPWLGHFDVDRHIAGGRVFIGLAEEDDEEIHRRMYAVAQAYQLTAEERHLVAERVVAIPLAGVNVALLTPSPDGGLMDSPEFLSLRKRLEGVSDEGWALVILDPLIRWANADVEKDNFVATRFIQALEMLTTVPGQPTVLLPHHSSKISRNAGAVDSRGVTALTDGVRWVATLRMDKGDAFFTQSKSNYSRPMREEIRLIRGDGGLLHAPSEHEQWERSKMDEARVDDAEAAKAAVTEKRVAKLMDELVLAIKAAPGSITSQKALLALVMGAQAVKNTALSRLLTSRRVALFPGRELGEKPSYRVLETA